MTADNGRPPMPTPEPTVRVTRYEVSCLPPDHPDRPSFTVVVEYRGDGRWAVMWNGAHFDADGGRSWGVRWEDGREPVTEEEMASYEQAHQGWLDRHRFDELTALRIASDLAPKLRIKDWTVEKVLADLAAKETDGA